jgi:predicted ATP-grasp superfamily ATP-dependent carboligase
VDLRGVAKIDFKYDPDGCLHLFEINARLTLWAHPGARAGVNLPAIMYTDLTGRPRPVCSRITGVDWVHPKDVLAARAHGIPMTRWLSWLWRTRPVTGVWKWDDPGPLLGMLAVRLRGTRSSTPAAD